jgi:hypothetical protein
MRRYLESEQKLMSLTTIEPEIDQEDGCDESGYLFDTDDAFACSNCAAVYILHTQFEYATHELTKNATLPNGVIRGKGGELMSQQGIVVCDPCIEDVTICRRCGCTDNSACEGGCWWVEEDLCSACDTNDTEDNNEYLVRQSGEPAQKQYAVGCYEPTGLPQGYVLERAKSPQQARV